MAKIIKFPDRKRAITQAEAQRRWLETNEIPVQYGWKWPTDSWLTRRLSLVRKKTIEESTIGLLQQERTNEKETP
jgi:hypothetical protein